MLLFLIFWPLAMAAPCALLGRKSRLLRDNLPLFTCLTELAAALFALYRYLSGASLAVSLPGVCGLGLTFTLDGFRAVWLVLIAFCWAASETVAREYLEGHRCRYHFFTLVTLCGTAGVFLSADLYTTLLFFETMSIASWAWVAHEDHEKAAYAADTYLAVAVMGGLATLLGLFLLFDLTGDLSIAGLYERCLPFAGSMQLTAAGVLLLLGFGAKAGMFPLHFWLPQAHPVAPAPASALLSGILTKCGLFGILVTSCEIFRGDVHWGKLVLGLGAVTMLWGAVLGVFSVDLKRTLACSSVSQIGFILTGVGMCGILGEENALAAAGTVLHMVNHSLIKLTLFLLAGVIAMNRHTLDLNRLRGCCRGNKPLGFAFLAAGLSVAGVPLFSGYISKTLLHESIVEGAALLGTYGLPLRIVEWMFLFSGGLTLAYMAKLFYVLFVLPPEGENPPLTMRRSTAAAVLLPAALMPVLGVLPHLGMDPLAQLARPFLHGAAGEPVAYFSLANLSGAAISVSIGVLVFLLFVRRRLTAPDARGVPAVRDVWPKWFDLEGRILRPLTLTVLPTVFGFIFRLLDYLPDALVLLLRKTVVRDQAPAPAAVSNSEALDRVGRMLDRVSRRRGKPSYVFVLAEKEQAFVLTTRLIFASLSFGLLLFCAGLTLTLCYLLL